MTRGKYDEPGELGPKRFVWHLNESCTMPHGLYVARGATWCSSCGITCKECTQQPLDTYGEFMDAAEIENHVKYL